MNNHVVCVATLRVLPGAISIDAELAFLYQFGANVHVTVRHFGVRTSLSRSRAGITVAEIENI